MYFVNPRRAECRSKNRHLQGLNRLNLESFRGHDQPSRPPTWPLPLDPTLIKLRDDEAVAYPKGWERGAHQLAIYSAEIMPSRGGGGHANWQIFSGEIIPSRGSLSGSGNRCLME